MNRVALFVILFSLGLYAHVSAESDNEVKARKTALDLAGAFSNDGFKIRDGHWSGSVKAQEPALIAVNLYAGNQYWFAAAADAEGKKIGVKVYDETGNPVTVEKYESGETAAAGFSPENSGQYYVSVSLLAGDPGSVCLVCSYK
jgi:hypothetical protein